MNVVNNTDEPRLCSLCRYFPIWGDSKHAQLVTTAGQRRGRERGEIEHSPEAVGAWVLALGARFGGQPMCRRDGTVARGSGFHAWKV